MAKFRVSARCATLLLAALVAFAATDRADPPGPTAPAPPEYSFLGYLQQRLAAAPPRLNLPDDPAAIPRWRERVAARLPDLLGLEHSQPVPLQPEVIAIRERDGYRVEHVTFCSEAGVKVRALVLVPHGIGNGPRVPAVLCLQGVVPGGKEELAGELEANAAAAAGVQRFRDDFARQFARAGFVTLAIDLRFEARFARRGAADPLGLNSRPNEMLLAHKYATMLGQSLFGLCLFDARRALDYLETRPEVRRDAIACAGFSFGSTLGAWLATIDRRIKVVALEGNWPSWRRLALENLGAPPILGDGRPFHWMDKASYQIVPGFLREFDLNLTVAAVAPTPMLLSYESDESHLYANRAAAERDVEPVRRAYAAFRAEGALRIVHVSGGHYWREEVIVPWLSERLREISP